jgi:hypothetical protein
MSRIKNTINIDEIDDYIDNEEYEDLFPIDQEFKNWMDSIERDYKDELRELAKLEVTKSTNIKLVP